MVELIPASVNLGSLESALQIGSVASGSSEGSVNWTYSIANSQLSWLGVGETLTLTSTVQINDGQGDTTNQNVTVTINGADDLPVLWPVTVTDKVGQTASADAAHGVLVPAHASDPVIDDVLTVSAVSATNISGTTTLDISPGGSATLDGQYGTLTLNGIGSYSYLEAAKHVPKDAQDIFTYTVSDGHDGTATSILDVVIGAGVGVGNYLQEIELGLAQANQYALGTTLSDHDLQQALSNLKTSIAQDTVEGILQEIGGEVVGKALDVLSNAHDLLHITKDLITGNFIDALQFVVDRAAEDAVQSISVPHEYDAAKIVGIFVRDYEAGLLLYLLLFLAPLIRYCHRPVLSGRRHGICKAHYSAWWRTKAITAGLAHLK